MILITGGTGTSGREIVEAVAKTGQPFRVTARDVARAEPLRKLGAEVVRGDFNDPPSLERAMAGVNRLFLNSGPTEDLPQLQGNVIAAARRAGVRHVVKLSVFGADLPQASTVRFMRQHVEVERALRDSGLAWTMLRPTFFMQNLLGSAATIRQAGAIFMPAADGRAPYIDTRDIADAAAVALTQPGHEGRAYELTGPEDLSFYDMAREIGAAIGRDVKYVPVSDEQARQSLLAAGIPAWNVEGMLELMRATRDGWMAGATGEVRRLTGHPARTFAAFAREHAAAFAG
jgi:uncharacterized protein YbjT (DUF2867 family)